MRRPVGAESFNRLSPAAISSTLMLKVSINTVQYMRGKNLWTVQKSMWTDYSAVAGIVISFKMVVCEDDFKLNKMMDQHFTKI